MRNGANITPRLRLAIACLAAGLQRPEGALVLGIPEGSYSDRLATVVHIYRKRGLVIDSSIDLVRAAEADGLVVKPERRA